VVLVGGGQEQADRVIAQERMVPAGAGTEEVWSPAAPVFVLCHARSGSTLLRFVLDAHPELACPPETNLPGLCAQLATVWSLIEGAPLSGNRGDEPPYIPQGAITGVQRTIDDMAGSYLERRGKKRYCDKSLGTARFAELLVRIWPEAKFLCLYRHPMDVVASGIEASPWGLSGYGFDPYIAATPGNAVHALASFWADNVSLILAVEEQFPDRCYRVRYEDMVMDPESAAAGLFAFLGVAAAPGISRACFSAERERFGPSDYKIWSTSQISPSSVGRGWSIPVGMVAPPVLSVINELNGKLGYLAVDDAWGTSEPPADLRAPVTTAAGADAGTVESRPGTATTLGQTADDFDQQAAVGNDLASVGPVHSRLLGQQLRDGLAADSAQPGAARQPESFAAVAVTGDPARPAEYWLVDLVAGTATLGGADLAENSDWDVIGSLDTWEQVMNRSLNLHVALRSCRLRYCDNGESAPMVSDTRIATLARLLDLANW
jgi:Sulfotransferase family